MPRSSAATRNKAKATHRVRQKSTVYHEERIDGKPLFFGWGGHLSKVEKEQVQRRIAWGGIGVVVLLILVVFGVGFIEQNVVIPNQPIIAIDGQTVWNYTKYTNAYRALKWFQPPVKGSFVTAPTDQTPQTFLDDAVNYSLILRGIQQIKQQNPSLPATTFDTASDIAQAESPYKSLIAASAKALNMSTGDLQDGMQIAFDIDSGASATKLGQYLLQQIKTGSNIQQIHLSHISLATVSDAEKVISDLKSGKDFATLAKDQSIDYATKTNGGDMGWHSQYDLDPVQWQAVNSLQAKQYTQSPVAVTQQDGSVQYDVLMADEAPISKPLQSSIQTTINDPLFDAHHYVLEQRLKSKITKYPENVDSSLNVAATPSAPLVSATQVPTTIAQPTAPVNLTPFPTAKSTAPSVKGGSPAATTAAKTPPATKKP